MRIFVRVHCCMEYSKAWFGKGWPLGQIWPGDCFCKQNPIRTQLHPFVYIVCIATFATTAELSKCNRSYGHKAGRICYWALCKESLWTPSLREKRKGADMWKQLVRKKSNIRATAGNPREVTCARRRANCF